MVVCPAGFDSIEVGAAVTRVLHVALSLQPGGTERLIVELAKRLHRDVPAAVCCLDVAGAWASELTTRGIHVTALGRAPGFRPALGRAVSRVAHQHGATVLHAHHYSPFVYSCLARLTRPSLRVVFTEHGRLGDTGPSPKRRLANTILARLADAVCAVSEDVRQHLIGEGFASSAVGIVYNGIEPGTAPDPAARARQRAALGIADRVLVVGTIARLDRVKDLGTLIRAVALAAQARPVELLIIGDGPERAHLTQLAARESGSAPVRFMGHLDDARAWLAGCDVYANSSLTEGISLTILEAMAAALPIVATRAGGTPEVIDETCGRLVAPRNPEAMADTIRALGVDARLRQTLGAAARRRVCDRFALDRMVAEYRQVYEGTRAAAGAVAARTRHPRDRHIPRVR